VVSNALARAGVTDALHAVLVGTAVALATWIAIAMTRSQSGVTIIWLASGMLAGILLTSPYRVWIAYIVAALIGNLLARALHGDAAPMVIARALASTLEACIVVYALRHFVGEVNNPANLIRVAWTAVGSTLAGCAVSALIAATASAAFGQAPFPTTFAAWFASHTLGMVIFATLVGVARELGWSIFGRPGRRWKFIRSMGLVTATTLWVFWQSRYPLLFLIFPPLVLAGFRHRFAGFAVGLAFIVVISVGATIAGLGPLNLVAGATAAERALLLQIFLAVTCLTTLPVAVVMAERGRFGAQLRRSERDYRTLADHSHDLVVHMRPDGRRRYMSPAVREMLGWEPADLVDARWDLIHADDREMLQDAMATLLRTGEPASVVYRAQHKLGYYVWIEALARRVPGSDPGVPFEIVYSGRDVSQRIQIEQALADNQRRLRAIADNLPALVAHVDTSERFTFVNAEYCDVLELGPERILGHTLPMVLGWRVYNEIRPRVQAALRGERPVFEAERDYQGRRRIFDVTYVPDVDDHGKVNGFLMLLFDITRLKQVERELALLARHDSLTGLANRLQFSERLALAIARQRRDHDPIGLIYLDIDHFKQVNDSQGHAVGDAILCEFARRLSANVRETDLAARLGGDEFTVLIERIDSPEVLQVIARKLLEAMKPACRVDALEFHVSASIGIGVGQPGDDAETLMRRADDALYAAKVAGRNTFRIAAVP